MHLGTRVVATTVAFTAFSGCTVLLRCVTRLLIVKNAGLDDILAVLAYLSSFVTTITVYTQYLHGLGQDIMYVDSHEIIAMLKSTHISVIFYGLAMTFLKTSALCQYFRFIFDKRPRIICWVLLGTCCVSGVIGLLVNSLTCRPTSSYEDLAGPNNECIHLIPYWYTMSVWNILTDVIVVAIPIVAVRSINMPQSQKQALIVVFALGGCGCVASIVRMYYVHVSAHSANTTRDIANAALWSVIEADIGIICISLPPLKALFVTLFPRLTQRSIRRGSNEVLTLAPFSATTDTNSIDLVQKVSVVPKHELSPYAAP